MGLLLLLLPIVAYFLPVLVGGHDWVEGLRTLGIIAALLCVGALAARLTSVWTPRWPATSAVLVLLLAMVAAGGAGGFLFDSHVHILQARVFESNHLWAAALQEYDLAGENGQSGAPDIARVYDEWGETLLLQHDYPDAVTQFRAASALSQFGDAADARAQKGLFQAYTAWIQAGSPAIPYPDAISFLDGYRQTASCDTACQSTAGTAEAQALYQYGSLLVTQGNLLGAIIQFETLQAHFPGSSLARQAHTAAADTYLALAKQQLSGNCQGAVSTYRTLATHYADTHPGSQAKAALSAPVSVTGTLTNYPVSPTPTVHLSSHAYAPIEPNAPPGSYYFSDDYATSVDPQTGGFTFTGVRPGTYSLSADWGSSTAWWGDTATNKLYFAQVGPVCSTNLGGFDDHLQH